VGPRRREGGGVLRGKKSTPVLEGKKGKKWRGGGKLYSPRKEGIPIVATTSKVIVKKKNWNE